MGSKPRLRASDIVVAGMMTAALEVAKTALAFLPNVELVTFLLIIYALVLGEKTFAAAFAFVGVECLIWGVNLWVVNYLYVWPLLTLITLVMKRKGCRSALAYAVLAGAFGLGFGALCAIPYLFIGGPVMMVSWWISGIPFDLIHGGSNFLLCLVLFHPVRQGLEKCTALLPE